MKIESAQIRNFRLLKELDIDFEEILSLVIGKNNSGKTSFLSILQHFLSDNNPEFAFEDFNIDTQQAILELEDSSKAPAEYCEITLSLKLYIAYEVTDNLGEAHALLLDLDCNKQHLVVLFEYYLPYEKYQKLVFDFSKYKEKGINRDFSYYVSNNINRYFSVRIKALEYGNESNFKIISNDIVRSIISMQTIGAKRDVANEQGHSKSLSLLAGKYYNASVLSEAEFPKLQQTLQETDTRLSETYERLFSPVLEEIAEMSYNPREAKLSVLSTLSEKKIFQDNTIVKYMHGDTMLPEDYNGLGYLNLFAIIFNLRIKLDQLSKKNRADENPTPLNLLFIEEPEAHTHPQMQYIFITNIKRILGQHREKAGKNFSLQTIISTHSSHIVSQCDFQDIKYFYRNSLTSVKSRSLKKLHSKMVTADDTSKKIEQERSYRFVKRYVTLNRAELFFANKAILIEGDTERMLIPAMMKKLDEEQAKEKNYEPLLSQNISIVEVGAYSHLFALFLGFLGIKTLIITDLDCAKDESQTKCKFTEGTITTNESIRFFTNRKKLDELVGLSATPITYNYDDKTLKWNETANGQLRIIYQKLENGYQARSFEDSFINKNLQFIIANEKNFTSLKNKEKLKSSEPDFYDISNECIKSKTAFALDILLYGGENNEDWTTPAYIKEGLEWLAQ